MTRASTFLLATFAAVALAGCGPRRADNTTGGAETGATGGAYDTTSAAAPTSDTGMPSGAGMTSDTGMKSDTGTKSGARTSDTTHTMKDSTAH